jgi:hypothetical protein
MHVTQNHYNDLTRKATELMSDSEEVARLLRARLGSGHHLVVSAKDVQESVEALVRELRCFCAADHDEIEVSEDT